MEWEEAIRVAVRSVDTGTSMSAPAVLALLEYVEHLEEQLSSEGLERYVIDPGGRWS